MIAIKNKSSLAKIEKAGQLLYEILRDVSSLISPGVSTLEIDAWIEKELRSKGLVPRTKGYRGYKHATCVSVNEELIHGIPRADKILKDGDLVKIDVIASWKGYCADMARSFFVGDIPNDVQTFVNVAQSALDKGIEKARSGNRLSDISAAIQKEVEHHGFNVVRDFAGHGIGKCVHEEPEIPNFGQPGQGPMLSPGMVLAIEPMITKGSYEVDVMDDGWTVSTRDKSLATHVEDTVVITEAGPKILTRYDHQTGDKTV